MSHYRSVRSLLVEELGIYLTLWKRLDLLRPNHHWLEVADFDVVMLDRRIAALDERTLLANFVTYTTEPYYTSHAVDLVRSVLYANAMGDNSQLQTVLDMLRDRALTLTERIRRTPASAMRQIWRDDDFRVLSRDEFARLIDASPDKSLHEEFLSYVRDNHLEDPKRPNVYRSDKTLQRIFGKSEVTHADFERLLDRLK